ncbi:hypothetical protein CASFOL_018570 [Castilleja foliolosa]|uniref:SAP domain-containing protein n=1 Tax=Castilleja foliolosa TaxID=1961234 RepID=A0ABD3D6S3_9LAMI
MSSPYVKLGNRSLDQWKVTELREELKKRKLTIKGLKEDLVKRLDEAVRTELDKSKENEESDEDDSNESELPLEQANPEPDVPGGAKDFMDVGVSMDEKVDAKPEHENDNHRSLFEGKVEVSLEQGTKAAELEGVHDTLVTTVETSVVISETVEAVTAVSDDDGLPHAQEDAKPELSSPKTQLPIINETSVVINETVEAVTAVSDNDGLPHSQEDANPELSGPKTQLPIINESSTPVQPSGGPNVEDTGTEDESLLSAVAMETDDPKYPQPGSDVQPLQHQVSEVVPDLGFQVTSDSVCTESLTIIEKKELNVAVITDNVQLEVDVKHKAQPPPSSAVPEEPLNKKDIQEPLEKKDIEELLDEKVSVEGMVDGLQNIDSEDLIPDKLNLDRSSGDDSMEVDIVESKPREFKSNSSKIGENVESSEKPTLKDEDHVVDVVSHDKPVETKSARAENESASSLAPVKRKFNDKAPVRNSDPVKKARRWNAEGLKGSEPQNSATVVSKTPEGLSEPTFKSFSGTSPAANEEASKERIVPPSSKPPTNSLRIDHFLRPFTMKKVQELLGKTGTVTGFWMDHIKTHCYVSYSSVEEAVGTRNAVYNLQWPTNGGRLLVAEFVDPQEVKIRAEAPLASPVTLSTSVLQNSVPTQPSPRQQQVPRQQQQLLPPPPPPPMANPPLARDGLHREALPREQTIPARERLNLPPPPPLPEKVEPPIVTLDDLFRKTKAMPRIYYLPLSDEQVAAKTNALGKNVANHHQ